MPQFLRFLRHRLAAVFSIEVVQVSKRAVDMLLLMGDFHAHDSRGDSRVDAEGD